MGNIQILDELTIDKIAAGEVIERPSSVVKELVENSIDSKANAITIEIKDGGISLIRITDNGTGIEDSDVPTAFLRHATSKIRSATDLLNISSLGFRGEALSSIAAVSQVELITKTSSELTGVRYMIAGGKEQSIEHIGCPEGTTFIVRNIFYNVPARQKFLKTPQTEGAHIYDLVQQLALSHPEISFQFIMNGQNRFHTSGNGNIKDIIYTVFGKDVAKNLLPFSFTSEELKMSVTGFIGKPVVSRGNRSFENYYVNKRYVKSNIIYKSVEEAYKTFTMVHRFPFVCLMFTIKPDHLDINVHPTKMELKFKDERRIYEVLKTEIRQVLLNQDLIPELPVDTKREVKSYAAKSIRRGAEPFETQRRAMEQKILEPVIQKSKDLQEIPQDFFNAVQLNEEPASYNSDKDNTNNLNNKANVLSDNENSNINLTVPKEVTKMPEQMTFADSGFLGEQAKPKHRIIGQLFKTYWLIEYDNKLFIMDQHAAHEKVNYERFIKHLQDKKNIYVQQVSPPIIVTLSPFGGEEYSISGVPTDLYGITDKDAFVALLDELADSISGTSLTLKGDLVRKSGNTSDVISMKIATMACKASVKGNQHLSFEEADRLVDELFTLESPFTCPHGRPTIISMTKADIEKKFKRIQDK